MPKENKEKEFKCEVCGKTFSKKIALIGHKRTHKKKEKKEKKEEKPTEAKKKEKPKKEIKYSPSTILLIIVALVIGVSFGFYLFSPKGGRVETTTTILTPTTTPSRGNVATEGKIVSVDYIGKFENGTVFDTSLEDVAKKEGIYREGRSYEPFTFPIGKGQVVKGFEEAILGMKVGEEKTVEVPPQKGYSSGPLAGKTLKFKIWVREIKEPQKVQLTVVNDPTCEECDTTRVLTLTNRLFPGVKINKVSSNSAEGKALIEKYDILLLPAYLFDENLPHTENYERNAPVFEKRKDKYVLSPQASGATHYVSEEARKKAQKKAEKERKEAEKKRRKELTEKIEPREKLRVELFVMAYCPYGTQMEKAILPVVKLLKDKIDFSIKFCSYAMHGKKELDEQILQYCIQKEQKGKYLDYLSCFLKEGKTEECVKETEINQEKLDSCIQETDEKFKITEKFEDKSTWLNGRFPLFDIYKEENEKYGIRGSPGLVINGAQVSVSRNPASLLNAVCLGFKDKPEGCEKELSSEAPSTGFGFSGTASSSSGGCGA